MNLQKLIRKVKRKLGIAIRYPSETSKVRHLVLPYCQGFGCDIGFGGDKIVKENCLGIDLPTPYANTGGEKVDIACDVLKDPIPVPDNYFDYVYTSHLIEDFADTEKGLKEFFRILKDGGRLILVFPDQRKYEEICKRTGQTLNLYHVHAEMSLSFMKEKISKIAGLQFEYIWEDNMTIDYNVILVIKKLTWVL